MGVCTKTEFELVKLQGSKAIAKIKGKKGMYSIDITEAILIPGRTRALPESKVMLRDRTVSFNGDCNLHICHPDPPMFVNLIKESIVNGSLDVRIYKTHGDKDNLWREGEPSIEISIVNGIIQ